MKKIFTLAEAVANAGCHKNDIDWLVRHNTFHTSPNIFIEHTTISIFDILNHKTISISDKKWFLLNSCNLSLKEKQLLALSSAKAVVNVYNNKYPNDTRISDCIRITALYLKGKVKKETLIKYKKAANAAAYAAYATDAAYAASAAYAAASAADAADAAYAANAAYAAAYAAYATDAAYATNATNAADAYTANIVATKLINNWVKTINTFD